MRTNRYVRTGLSEAQFDEIRRRVPDLPLHILFGVATEVGIGLTLTNGEWDELMVGVGQLAAHAIVLDYGRWRDERGEDNGDYYHADPGTTDPVEMARQALAAALTFVAGRWEDEDTP